VGNAKNTDAALFETCDGMKMLQQAKPEDHGSSAADHTISR